MPPALLGGGPGTLGASASLESWVYGGVLAPRPAPPGGGPIGNVPGARSELLATPELPGHCGGMPGGGPICNNSPDAFHGGGPCPDVLCGTLGLKPCHGWNDAFGGGCTLGMSIGSLGINGLCIPAPANRGTPGTL